MNLRCTYCQTPFTVGRLEKLAALQRMQAENLHHYDVFCPRCRRANSVSRQRLEIFTPGWQEGLKTLEAEAAQIEKVRTEPVPAPVEAKSVPALVEAPRNRHASKPAVAKAKPAVTKAKPVAKAKPAAKKPAAKVKPAAKPALKKTAAKPKPAAKKPAAKAKSTGKKSAAKKK
jgi:hypothetical protein